MSEKGGAKATKWPTVGRFASLDGDDAVRAKLSAVDDFVVIALHRRGEAAYRRFSVLGGRSEW